VGTLYWENLAGLEQAAAIFAAPSPEEAWARIRRCGVTHIVLLSWDPFALDYARLYRGSAPAEPEPPGSFASLLLRGLDQPPWLRPLPYWLPRHPALSGKTVKVFEVVEPAGPAEAVIQTAEFLLEIAPVEAARQMESWLESPSAGYPALVMLAFLQGKTAESARFPATLERVAASRPPLDRLTIEDEIRLTVVLAMGGQTDAARQVLQHCHARIDAPALRQLTTGLLLDLQASERMLAVELPDRQLRQLALDLVPPVWRQHR
jgi:hypothetical protein